jgi:DNA repair and recombination protein RAD52
MWRIANNPNRPGDQHRDNANTINPFAPPAPRISEWTAQEIATLASRLEKQLGPEYISTRPGAGGGKVHYLAAEKVINLANEVFGFNGWSSSVQNVQIDFVDENTTNGKITLGLSTIVRVTLRDGTYHEDIGYGHIENCKGKAAAFEKAKKEAVTDAMKRALRNFGNVLGNCLYDKDYLSKVTKVKVAPSKWDADNLYRHPDFAPAKRESIANAAVREQQTKSSGVQGNGIGEGNEGGRTSSMRSAVSIGSGEFDDDFGGNDLDDTDFSHPDEVRLDDSRAMESPAQRQAQSNAQRNGVQRMQSMPNIRAQNLQPPQPPQGLQASQKPPDVQKPPMNGYQPQPGRMLPPQTPGKQHPPVVANGPIGFDGAGIRSHSSSAEDGQPQQEKSAGPNGHSEDYQPPMPTEPPAGVLAGFVTGRSASLLNQASEGKVAANAAAAFNPHAESPSIRRTQGVNPGKSAPIMRESLSTALANASTGAQQAPGNNGTSGPGPNRANFTNPSIDPTRRIGMPGGGPNRGAYKPPSAVKRPALTDVSNLPQTDGGVDSKRQRVESPAPGVESGPG